MLKGQEIAHMFTFCTRCALIRWVLTFLYIHNSMWQHKCECLAFICQLKPCHVCTFVSYGSHFAHYTLLYTRFSVLNFSFSAVVEDLLSLCIIAGFTYYFTLTSFLPYFDCNLQNQHSFIIIHCSCCYVQNVHLLITAASQIVRMRIT